MKKVCFFCCVIVMLFIGCTNLRLGYPVDQSEVRLLEQGYTNEDEILKKFGQPAKKVALDDGGEIWLYRNMDGNGGYSDLIITLNSKKILASYSNE
ncbi:MAG: hypothetical protein HUU50_10230 [Candidatus Brocadiae bacterium]|nr:hypothetical protein [Candidatus Brocadiia bacterium]